MKHARVWAGFATALIWTATVWAAGTADTNSIMTELKQMAASAENTPQTTLQRLSERLEADPVAATDQILLRLSDPATSGHELAVYAWALGWTRQPKAVQPLIDLASREPGVVRLNSLRALAEIGGDAAGHFLLKTLDATSDDDLRFELLGLMGQMHYAPALSRTMDLLRKDIKKDYWRCVFVFGKMGDTAVPFLIQQTTNADFMVRMNAINVLGQWLIAPEAASALKTQFWKEPDEEVRGMILHALERILPGPDALRRFSEEVVTKCKDEKLVSFARETLANLQDMRRLNDFRAKRKPSAAEFQREWDRLYASAGKSGDYTALALSSTSEDEPKLKRLRERILQRNSDEAFYDYQKVNDTIMMLRYAKNTM